MAIEDEIKRVVGTYVKDASDKMSLEVKNNLEKLDEESEKISLQLLLESTKLTEKIKTDIQKLCEKECEKLKQDIEKFIAQVKDSFTKRTGGKTWFWLK
jgi:hypothetical protein